jgi:hypothetical protein
MITVKMPFHNSKQAQPADIGGKKNEMHEINIGATLSIRIKTK